MRCLIIPRWNDNGLKRCVVSRTAMRSPQGLCRYPGLPSRWLSPARESGRAWGRLVLPCLSRRSWLIWLESVADCANFVHFLWVGRFVDNFRDVAGAASGPYTSVSGAALRSGVFYRSSALVGIDAKDHGLDPFGIVTVYDLRTPSEIERQPDVLPTGARYVRVNVLGEDRVTFGTLSSAADTVAVMEALERQMVTDAGMRARLATLFTALADGEGAQLFHCTGGKDRTGWVAALLQLHAGVSQDDVMHDYLLTNALMTRFIDTHYDAVAREHGKQAAEAILPALGVRESFLLAGLDQVQQDYGSVSAYLEAGMGLDLATLEKLRGKLLG